MNTHAAIRSRNASVAAGRASKGSHPGQAIALAGAETGLTETAFNPYAPVSIYRVESYQAMALGNAPRQFSVVRSFGGTDAFGLENSTPPCAPDLWFETRPECGSFRQITRAASGV